MTKIITVIIPTYNRKLNFNLISKFDKFKKKIEVIIVDDGSDKLINSYNLKLIKNFSNCKYFHYNKNRGQSYACNYGIKKTNTKYIWFFDDDDLVKEKTIKSVLVKINDQFDGLLLPMQQIYKNKIIKEANPWNRNHDYDDLRNNGQLVNTSCAIFSTKIIKSIGGWDTKLLGGTDTDLFLRFSLKGKFQFLKSPPIIINLSQSNRLTNNVLRQQIAKIYFLRKHWNKLTLKRRIYYILAIAFFYTLFYGLKNELYLLKKN